jgi:hypothetical protein
MIVLIYISNTQVRRIKKATTVKVQKSGQFVVHCEWGYTNYFGLFSFLLDG